MNRHQTEGAARSLAGQIEQEAGRSLGNARLRADGAFQHAIGAAEERYGDAIEGVRGAAEKAGRYAESVYEEGRKQVENSAQSLNKRVEANPVMAVLVAGLLGYALGVLTDLTRRR